MNTNHWSDEQLLERLYDVREPDAHVDSCPECSARWQGLLQRRAQVPAAVEVDSAFMAAQRRAIHDRISRPAASRLGFRAVTALSTVAVLALALVLVQPPPTKTVEPTQIAKSDAQLFAEIYSVAESAEPLAAQPIRALFEDQ
jgi:hypothetical protein